jgi:hypothetical protein
LRRYASLSTSPAKPMGSLAPAAWMNATCSPLKPSNSRRNEAPTVGYVDGSARSASRCSMAPAGRSRLIPTTRALSHGTALASAPPMPPDAPEIHTRELAMGPNLLRTAQGLIPGSHYRPHCHRRRLWPAPGGCCDRCPTGRRQTSENQTRTDTNVSYSASGTHWPISDVGPPVTLRTVRASSERERDASASECPRFGCTGPTCHTVVGNSSASTGSGR